MGDIVDGIFTTIFIVELVIGNVGNGFIALVNCTEWVKRRKMVLVDRILTALAISRMGLLWSVAPFLLIRSIHPGLPVPVKLLRMLTTSWIVTSHFNTWLATCLSIFYFLKIANFSNSVFLYFKWRVKKVISVALLLCLLFLFSNITLMELRVYALIDGSKTNVSVGFSLERARQFSRICLLSYVVSCFIPFSVSLMAFLLLILSLGTHLRKMRRHTGGSRDVGATVHLKALQTAVTFLILYLIYFLSLLAQVWKSTFRNILFCQAVAIASPSGHSFILILENRKLRQAFLSALRCVRRRSGDATLSEP
ncbi:taste receptor type 2 member 140-like [Ctenodactylus gundi]